MRPARRGQQPSPRGRRRTWAALVAILGLAVFLRLDGLHWDALVRTGPDGEEVVEEQHLHPDERFLTMVTDALEIPESWREYFATPSSPLNPHNRGFGFYAYGTLPLLLTKLVGSIAGMEGYGAIHIVGRVLAATASLLTVLFTFVLARRLYGAGVALLAAALLALAALPIQQAHFYTVDAFGDAFVALALVAAVGIQRRGRMREYVGFGAALGAAMACKLNLVVLAGVAVAAAGWRLASRGEEAVAPAGRTPTHVRATLHALGGLTAAAAVAFLLFRVLQPYAFAGPGPLGLRINPEWWGDMQEVRELVSGARDYPPGHQWADRVRPWFPWKNMGLWGLGPMLGLAAWGGFALAGFELLRRGRSEHVVPWSWVLLLFGYQGVQWVTSMRYFLPIYPALCVLAALLVARLWIWGRASSGRGRQVASIASRPRVATAAVCAAIVLGTLAWAWAFTSIYRRTHSRIRASQWIYANVPPGASIANEVWDDALPLRLEGRDAFSIYRGVEMHNYAEDTPEKLEITLESLDRSDVLVLSSNRLYDSIPRLPMRYPMMVRYYRHLFSGELGFRRVAEFTSYPRLLGIEFPDQKAEEAWSVYDHPRVQIFVRTADWSLERARELLEPSDWDEIDRLSPRDARDYRTLMMDEELRRAQRAGGTGLRAEAVEGARRGLFAPDGFAARHPILVWVAALELLGLVAFPLCWLAFPRFADRGWMLSKAVGLLVVGFSGWLAASLRWAPWSRATLLAAIVALGGAGIVLGWRARGALIGFLRERSGLVVGQEIVFWAFFAFLLWCRYQNPDLWHAARGGEKPMDFAYLNAVVKSSYFPPYDPWFAGGYINYYYYGFVLAAVPVLLTGVAPAVAYNLIVPTFFALTAAGASSGASALVSALGPKLPAGADLRRRLLWGTAGALLVVGVGNLTEPALVVRGLRQLGGAQHGVEVPARQAITQAVAGASELRRPEVGWPLPNDWWFWNASRAIPHPETEPPAITEFPFFTFLFADLHAHMMAMPVTLLVLALAIHLALSTAPVGRGDPFGRSASTSWMHEACVLLLLALAVGGLYAINTWDYPLAVLLLSLGLLLREASRSGWLAPRAWWSAGWRVALVAVAGRLLYHPFHDSFVSAYTEAMRWTGARTPVAAYLAIHGLFLLLLLSWMVRELALSRRLRGLHRMTRCALRHRARAPRTLRSLRRLIAPGDAVLTAGALSSSAAAGGLLAAGFRLEAFLAAALLLTAALALERAREPAVLVMCFAILIGLGLSALVEHVVLSGDIGRMNTVFKFYLQIWLLWGTCSAAALGSLVVRRAAVS
ncbi:MAG TPA: DUF2298 domain-containing protein, partial [Planctomycetota bacterium]|nr:DUF2298 domain-containing protein [Planctomycetota bacterium]